MTQLAGKVVLFAGCLAMTGCVGLGVPIGRRVPEGRDGTKMDTLVTAYEDYYKDPRRLALWRIAQWDHAMGNIQGGNTAANVGLAGVATALGYSAARELSKSTTIGLAAGGLFGMSLSEAMVQVSRVNVYSAGIRGMECALASYGEPIQPHGDVTDSLAEHRTLVDDWADRYAEIVRIREDARLAMDEGMLLAVSRITRNVEAALMGSFVSANSRGAGWTSTFSTALNAGATDKQHGATARLPVNGVPVAQIVKGPPSPEDLQKRLAKQQAELAMDKAMAEAKALSRVVEQRRARLDACDLDGTTAEVERVGAQLGVDLLGGVEPLVIKQGASTSFRVFGGVPAYSVGFAGTGPAPEATINQSGIALVTVNAKADTPPGAYEAVVADSTGAAARKVQVVVEKK